MCRCIVLAALFAIATPAKAGELVPRGAESIQLGSLRGVIYYTEAEGGYRVTTTLADGEGGFARALRGDIG
jgi:hypothetical protein